jgi:hypothetical protein
MSELSFIYISGVMYSENMVISNMSIAITISGRKRGLYIFVLGIGSVCACILLYYNALKTCSGTTNCDSLPNSISLRRVDARSAMKRSLRVLKNRGSCWTERRVSRYARTVLRSSAGVGCEGAGAGAGAGLGVGLGTGIFIKDINFSTCVVGVAGLGAGFGATTGAAATGTAATGFLAPAKRRGPLFTISVKSGTTFTYESHVKNRHLIISRNGTAACVFLLGLMNRSNLKNAAFASVAVGFFDAVPTPSPSDFITLFTCGVIGRFAPEPRIEFAHIEVNCANSIS